MRSQKDIDTIESWKQFHSEMREILRVKYNTIGCTKEKASEVMQAVVELVSSFDGCCPENIDAELFGRLQKAVMPVQCRSDSSLSRGSKRIQSIDSERCEFFYGQGCFACCGTGEGLKGSS